MAKGWECVARRNQFDVDVGRRAGEQCRELLGDREQRVRHGNERCGYADRQRCTANSCPRSVARLFAGGKSQWGMELWEAGDSWKSIYVVWADSDERCK